MDQEEREIEALLKWREEMMEKHGWYVDAAIDTENCKCETGTGCNIHTHGLVESFKHPDLQCVVPINPETIHGVFNTMVDMIKKGKTFKPGKCYSGILKNEYKIRVMLANENGRNILRVILPDENGKVHRSTIKGIFACQYNEI